jgi:hypothetical protein
MKRSTVALCIASLLLLSSCQRAGHIEVLTPLTSGDAEETRRQVLTTEAPITEPGIDEILEFTVNLNSLTFHLRADCIHAERISEENRAIMTDCAQNLINQGYVPCKSCSECFAAETDENA